MKKNLLKEEKTEPYEIFLTEWLTPIPHIHKEIEIVLVIDGKAVAHADREEIPISSGDLFVSFPNQVHYYENSSVGKYGVYIISIDTLFCKKDVMLDNIPENITIRLGKDDELYKQFLELLNVKKTSNKDIITGGLINLCFGKLLDRVKLKPRLKTENSALESIINYCTLNFNSNLSLDELADSMHLSKYYVSYLFNNKLKISFNNYINTLRVKAACDMLTETDKNMADISLETGFGSIRSFNRAFTQIMNLTPTAYRKMKKSNKW